MKTCPKCGTECDDENRFCFSCGASFSDVKDVNDEYDFTEGATEDDETSDDVVPEPEDSNEPLDSQNELDADARDHDASASNENTERVFIGADKDVYATRTNSRKSDENRSGGKKRPEPGIFDTADHTSEFDDADINANKIYGILACFGILFFIPLVAAPNSRYGKYWANQGLLLLIVYAVCGTASGIIRGILSLLSAIPFVGVVFSVISWIVGFAVWAFTMVILVMSLVNAANGRAKDLPIIGKITIIK